jgi:hypothetical protein
VKDPYYRKILEGLAGPLDPHAFQSCANDLLKDIYPGLVRIHGSYDYGMDGAIADGEGEAFPLIVTTAMDVIGNLTRSLHSYARSGGPRRLAVVAISTALTPTKRRNLEKRAQDREFTLVQIHDRWDFADRLYRNSRWARELLGVTPEPSALSSLPQNRRPMREDIPLVGREADLEWLRRSAGDRLVVGQPGSGKTRLLLELVRDGEGLFLASDDEGRIANACRDLEPTIIIVDDAHFEPMRLERLRQIREEIGATFDIIATTWPGAEDNLADALGGIADDQVRHLELLTRAQILEVLHGIGVQEPDDDPYLRQLVDQASNKPGLAVTLGSLWLRGELRDVLTGEAIRRTLIPSLTRVLENDPTRLLACFALGGDCGMSIGTVGDFLGLGLGEVHRLATLASQGGVLEVLGGDRLAVSPEMLRPALLQEIFFKPPALAYSGLLEQAADIEDAVETLTLAAMLEVPVPEADLRLLVLRYGSRTAWRRLAALSEADATWVLEHYPGNFLGVAYEVLTRAPRAAISRLLQDASQAQGFASASADPPLQILKDWVQELPDERWKGILNPMQRRQLAVEVARRYLEEGGVREIGLRACFAALNPRMETSRETVTGGAVSIRQALLGESSVPKILSLWSELKEVLREFTKETWSELEEAIHEWVHPEIPGIQLSEKHLKRMWRVPRQILTDLLRLSKGNPGLQLALLQWAGRVKMSLDVKPDPDFAVLYPLEDHLTPENWQEEEKKENKAALALAGKWATHTPEDVARKLVYYGEQAEVFQHQESRLVWVLCRGLAEEVSAPEVWLMTFVRYGLGAISVEPFLARVLVERKGGWREALAETLAVDRYSGLAACALLESEGLPSELTDAALEAIVSRPDLIQTSSLRGAIPSPTLQSLLVSPDMEIVLAAAIGEWLAPPRGQVRIEVVAEWRKAILSAGKGGGIDRSRLHRSHYWLKQILRSDPELAYAWLGARIQDVQAYEVVSPSGIYASAIRPLESSQRVELLQRLRPGHFGAQLIQLLVDDSAVVYDQLLKIGHLRKHQLAPLQGRPADTTWIAMARLALDAGHEPRKIAEVAFHNPGIVSGFGEAHWSKWRRGFEHLLDTAEGKLREVAESGLQIAESHIGDALERKRQFELTGQF